MTGRRLRKLQFRESPVTHRHGDGWYHVMNRGIDAGRLFPDNKANEHFRELLARMPTRFGLRIHAYVLMGNHYHLQIETLRPNLSRAIQWLNLSFSAWYNRLHEYPAVSLAIARFEKRLKTDRSLEKRLKQVIKLLNVEM